MRIVYIIKYIAQLGGLDRVMSYKINYMAEQGHDVHVITYEQGQHPLSFPLLPQVHHHDINVRFFTRHGGGLLKRVVQYVQMRRTFKQRLYAQVEQIAPDVIVTLTDSYTLLDILQGIPGKAFRVIESHVERGSFQKRNDFKGRPVFYQLASLFDAYITRQIKRADCFVALTEHDARSWSELKRVEVIPNPLSYIPTETAALTNKVVISAGRLEDQKGYDLLIDTWAKVAPQYPDWQLHVYGDGGNRATLERQTRARGLAHCIQWYHSTPHIFEAYLNSSLYVMSSRYEGFGLVLTEAMSCGLPCVSFDCPYGPSDIIRQGEDGLLVPLGDTQALADALCQLMGDEAQRKRMGALARQHVMRYAPEVVMKRWEALFQEGAARCAASR